MELSSLVIVCYLGTALLGIYPRRKVRISYRIVQDPIVLVLAAVVLSQLCYPITAAVLLTAIAVVMYSDLPAPWTDPRGRAVFITGCDHGLGHALALRLDKLGMTVFAGCLFKGGEGEKELVRQASDRLVTLQLDVTDQGQVAEVAREVQAHLDGRVLHGVVNNAGILMSANMEVMSWADIRKIFEVNLFGVISVYRAFMPMLRQRGRDTPARLVNISSNIGIAPTCQMGAYVVSKAAVAQLGETWRQELRKMGVSVSTIVPSGFRTGILMYDKEAAANRWWQAASPEVQDYFGRGCFILVNRVKSYKEMLNPDTSSVVECMADALLSHHPRPMYYRGLMARSLCWLFLHCPSCVWDLLAPHIADFYHFPVQALEGNAQMGQS
ncbi:estradiol 17-beta-dehydrogenase 2 [Plakobranchus ocellatus]|uniref:Estradiol 17-beta-dehydrogenase 2 n=1 Tax=Plakobranchus ocellatus TaxID=259542 RepID=A0AAV4AX12_9GAST|nr:estradiol 17-beta-dehydrogenase 2 [Plakobranchus ocellatus]